MIILNHTNISFHHWPQMFAKALFIRDAMSSYYISSYNIYKTFAHTQSSAVVNHQEHTDKQADLVLTVLTIYQNLQVTKSDTRL